ncbi:MAG: peptidoglycan-associated lipoprotein Pal [Sterolibacterium sp.]|jgi:peptidoglycan-associated lipoprotein
MNKPLAVLFLSTLLAACSSTPPASDKAMNAAPPASRPAQPADSRQVPVAAKPLPSELNDPASALAKRRVFFPYDVFIVDQKYDQTLSAHASYLTRNPATRITLEGNADERGSSEYNLALGQKRAEAVRKSLSLRGVADKQMEAVSYGKERPKATCHEESCWQENRRTDIVYSATR